MVVVAARVSFAREVARKVLRQYKLTVPVSIESFVSDTLGYTVMLEPLEGGLSAVADHDNKILMVNKNEVPNRRRFSVAHEMAHYFLGHSKQMLDTVDQPYADLLQGLEREANSFAAELLMPSEAFSLTFRQGATPDQLAEKFGVSKDAVWVRITELKLL